MAKFTFITDTLVSFWTTVECETLEEAVVIAKNRVLGDTFLRNQNGDNSWAIGDLESAEPSAGMLEDFYVEGDDRPNDTYGVALELWES
jgi:hypothetical protein